MKIIAGIYKLLNKPFPEQESSFAAPKTVVIISVFVTFFLYIFQPFGISNLESGKFFICLGFGSATFAATIIYDFIVGHLLHLKGELEHWTFGNWMLNNLGLMLAISLANFLFARLVIFGYIEWELFPYMIYGTFMIGIIPFTILGGLALIMQEKKYQKIASQINQHKNVTSIDDITEQFLFNIPVKSIKYIEALQNYVAIGYTDSDGLFKKSTERTTLKSILEQLSEGSIVRSHRSFLVNHEAIISISGNAQGLLLKLSGSDKTIPVSRSYVHCFRDN